MPVTRPAAGASLSYIPQAASGDNSRKADPGSISASMRSRTGSLPCSRCRARYLGPPPRRAWATRSRCSWTSASIRSRLARKSAEAGSICEVRGSITSPRLPSAAIRLESAGRATPDGVHAVHLGTAALALHRVFRRRGWRRSQGRDDRGDNQLDRGLVHPVIIPALLLQDQDDAGHGLSVSGCATVV